MAIHRLNHAALDVQNVERSSGCYRELLGVTPREGTEHLRGAAFLTASSSTNDHDLGLIEIGMDPARPGHDIAPDIGLYHLAWEVDTLNELRNTASTQAKAGALVGFSGAAHRVTEYPTADLRARAAGRLT